MLTGRQSTDEMKNTSSFLLFTNNDARALPFGNRYFDFVICKNVLHHMPNLESVNRLVGETVRVGKRALIVEVMNPAYEGWFGRRRHWYYTKWLHDAGEFFLSREAFNAVTNLPERVDMFEMSTIRGVYQFALFSAR